MSRSLCRKFTFKKPVYRTGVDQCLGALVWELSECTVLFTINTCILPANVEFLYMLGNLCDHPTPLPQALNL